MNLRSAAIPAGVFLSGLLFVFQAVAQTADNKPEKTATASMRCNTPQHALMDFWVGTWKGTWRNPQSGNEDSASNVVVRSHDGCVIHESFRQGARGLVGSSFSVFDAKRGNWRQTWVDNTGAYMDFVGTLLPDGMSFSRETEAADGTKVWERMRFFNATSMSFDWEWERSTDGGKSWVSSWKIRYLRVSTP